MIGFRNYFGRQNLYQKLEITLKSIGFLLLIPILYLLISIIFSSITIDRELDIDNVFNESIYLNSNGVHLDIILPAKNINSTLSKGIVHNEKDVFIGFGWGDENFFINTPTWSDLTFTNAFRALFLKSTSLMHVNRYHSIQSNWIEIKISSAELHKLNTYILSSFRTNSKGEIIILENQGYSSSDNFYKATGSYSCFKTCNTWANSAFRYSGLKSCYWTPFDFGLTNQYKN